MIRETLSQGRYTADLDNNPGTKEYLVRPALAAAQLRGSLTQYLTTTYALTGGDTRLALGRFLGHSVSEIFRGPYLRMRTPFHKADRG